MIATLIEPVHRRWAALGAVLIVAAAIVVSLLSDRAPGPVPASAPPGQFSAERAVGQLERFATEPRPIGSAASDRARDYLAGELRSAGFSVQVDQAFGKSGVQGAAEFGRVENIVATLPGRAPTGSVLLVAHYDSVPAGSGASDDGAGVAAMLETVRALGTQGGLRNDLVLLITDGEESGLLGAEAYARSHPLLREPGVVLNWEARGTSGPSLMFETSRDNAALVGLFADAAPHPHGDSASVELYRQSPNNTDFTRLAEAGLSGMNFAYIEDAARYHTSSDTIANLDPASLQNHGANMLGLTRVLGDADLSTLDAEHDATYFRLLGHMITYSDALVWPLALLAVIALGALVTLARRRRLLSIPRLLLGIAVAALPLLTAGLLAQGLWLVLLVLRPDYAGSSFLYRPGFYQAAVAGVAALSVTIWYLLLRRRVGPAALACGGMVWPATLGAVLAWAAPGTSFLFALPALAWACGGLVAVLLPRERSFWPVVAMTAATVPAVVLLMAPGLTTLGAFGLALAGVSAALLALVGLVLLPLAELLLPPLAQPIGRRRTVAVPVAGVLLVLALTGAGLIADRPDAQHPRRDDLLYVLDVDAGRANWVSRDVEPTSWTRRYVTARSEGPGPVPEGFVDGPVWTGQAPAVRAPTSELTVRSHTRDGITLHVASPRSAYVLILQVDHRVEEITVTAPGLPPTTVALDGTLPGRWPSVVLLGDLPAEGAEVRLRVPHEGPLQVGAYDLSYGLTGIPGFVPRPPDLEPHISSDVIVSARTYDFPVGDR